MLDQITFDRSEEIAAALHDQEGLAMAMQNIIAGLNLPIDTEQVLFALLHGQDHARNRAALVAAAIAHEGAERRPSG